MDLTKEQMEYDNILDDLTNLSIKFHNDNNIDKYNNHQLIAISTLEYFYEVMNGGLCQFFDNSSRKFAPILSKSLGKINALKHKIHFDNFVIENEINLDELCSTEDLDEFIDKYDDYPFDDFDSKFYEIDEKENLCDLIIEYVKNNYNDILK